MTLFRVLIVAALVTGGVSFGSTVEAGSLGKTNEIAVAPQPWQMRRAKFADTLKLFNVSQGRNRTASANLDRVLTGLERDRVSVTPIEAMDIFGAFYVPWEFETKLKRLVSMVSAYAILGWYDALRFADASGRAEIVNNELFFARAFYLGGEKVRTALIGFLTENRAEADEAIAKGVADAMILRTRIQYDETWPTAYGMRPLYCAMKGKTACPKPPVLPKENWDAAFDEAVATVQRYYTINPK